MLRDIYHAILGIGGIVALAVAFVLTNFGAEVAKNALAFVGFVPAAEVDRQEKLLADKSNELKDTNDRFAEWKRERLNGDPIVYSGKAPIMNLTGDQCLEVARTVLKGLKYEDIYTGHGDQSHYLQARFTINNAPGKVLFDCFHHDQGLMSPTVSIAYKIGNEDDGRKRVNDIREALRKEINSLGVAVLPMRTTEPTP